MDAYTDACPLAGYNNIPGVLCLITPSMHPSVPGVRLNNVRVVVGHDHDDDGHNPTVQSEHSCGSITLMNR